jgi:hypothetical protein
MSPILDKTGNQHGAERIPPRVHPLDEYVTKEEMTKLNAKPLLPAR